MPREPRLVNIWEDTVDLTQLLIGIAGGSALGFVSYVAALRAFSTYFPEQPPSLVKGYALMAGIAGCVLTAAVIATVFKPKRRLRETEPGPVERDALVRGLALDPEEERRALETASPDLLREMQELQIHELFAEPVRRIPH